MEQGDLAGVTTGVRAGAWARVQAVQGERSRWSPDTSLRLNPQNQLMDLKWVVGKEESQDGSQVPRSINWWMQVPFAGTGGSWEEVSFGNAEFELSPGCPSGDGRHAVGTCAVHQLFLFSSQTHGGLYFSAHLNLDEGI